MGHILILRAGGGGRQENGGQEKNRYIPKRKDTLETGVLGSTSGGKRADGRHNLSETENQTTQEGQAGQEVWGGGRRACRIASWATSSQI